MGKTIKISKQAYKAMPAIWLVIAACCLVAGNGASIAGIFFLSAGIMFGFARHIGGIDRREWDHFSLKDTRETNPHLFDL